MSSVDCPQPRPLIVDLARYFGGPDVRVLDVAAGLERETYQVACLKRRPLAERAQAVGLPLLELTRGRADPRLALTLAKCVRRKFPQKVVPLEAVFIVILFWKCSKSPHPQEGGCA